MPKARNAGDSFPLTMSCGPAIAKAERAAMIAGFSSQPGAQCFTELLPQLYIILPKIDSAVVAILPFAYGPSSDMADVRLPDPSAMHVKLGGKRLPTAAMAKAGDTNEQRSATEIGVLLQTA
eukprot:gene7342-8740_t